MIKIEHVAQYLDALVKNDEVFEILKSRYPEILADIVSSRENPNCGCRSRTSAHITKRYMEDDQEKVFINSILSRPDVLAKAEEIDASIKKHQEERQASMVDKTKFTISNNEESWSAFSKWIKSSNVQFKSFSVVDKGNLLDIYII